MKESVKGIRRAPLFRETFNSFNSIKKNGGEQTNVDLSNGVGSFNGSSSTYTSNTNFKGVNNISLRVKFNTSVVSHMDVIAMIRNDENTGYYFGIEIYSTTVVRFITASGFAITKTFDYFDGQEHDLVITKQANNVSAYVDGEFIGDTISADFSFDSIGNLVIGHLTDNRHFNGDIELAEIYDYALSANEVKLLHEEELHTSVSNKVGYSTEMIVNGSFDSDSDWVSGGGGTETLTISDGTAKLEMINGSSDSMYMAPSDVSNTGIVAGRKYLITWDLVSNNNSSPAWLMYQKSGESSVFIVNRQNVGSHSREYTPTYSGGYFSFGYLGSSYNTGDILEFDNISVNELTGAELTPILEYDFVKNKSAYNNVEYGDELVTNGDFSSGLTGWTPRAASSMLTIENNKLKVLVNGASYGYAYQAITTKIGKTYKWSVDVGSSTGTSIRLSIGITGIGSDSNLSKMITEYNKTYSGTFVATGTVTLVNHYVFGDGAYGFFDNISLTEVNNENQSLTDVKFGQQGLIANGSTTKFDTGSTADLTGDITVEAIINPASFGENGIGRIIDNLGFIVWINDTNDTLFVTSNNGATNISFGINSIKINDKSKHIIITRINTGITNVYLDGVQIGTANQSSGNPLPVDTNIIIGNRNAGDRTFDGAIKVVNVYSGIATLKQIEKRYNYWIDRGYVKR